MLIRMIVPFPISEENRVSNDMAFASFVPDWNEESLQLNEEDLCLKMGFDASCVSILGEDRNYSRMVHVPVGSIRVEITVKDLPGSLLDHIKNNSPHEGSDQNLLTEYRLLGKRVYDITIKYVNRVIQFARAVKGQFWLEEYHLDPDNMLSAFNFFRAAAYVEGNRYPFTPSNVISLKGCTPTRTCLITNEDWKGVLDYIKKGRYPLVGQLLAGAQYLASKGHKRAALTEAVTALEVAVFDFGKRPNSDGFGKQMMERTGIASLKNQIDHLGFSGSVKYLLPLIIREDLLPNDVLKNCQEAICVRQNVVHNGQLRIDNGDLWRFLVHIRRMCEVLSSLTCPE